MIRYINNALIEQTQISIIFYLSIGQPPSIYQTGNYTHLLKHNQKVTNVHIVTYFHLSYHINHI